MSKKPRRSVSADGQLAKSFQHEYVHLGQPFRIATSTLSVSLSGGLLEITPQVRRPDR